MKNKWMALVPSAVLAAGLALIADFLCVWSGRALSVPKFGVLFLTLIVALWLIPAVTPKIRKWGLILLLTLVGLLAAAQLCWYSVSQGTVYEAPDQGKSQLYGGKKVMLLVPHQDDDINVLGGVIEEYRKYGSEIHIVFSTNGDYYGLAEIRYREALSAAEKMGVKADHVIFLGYGDQWDPDGPHIYNAAPGDVVQSYLGRRETYGTQAHSAYREGNSYTSDQFLQDLQSVILEHRADILYCVDRDYNIDHRALSLAFEKVMGRILKDYPDYQPAVFKGYAYETAWEAEKDFYGDNLPATQEPENIGVYRWEERIRLPVHAEGLSRSVISAGAHEILSSYESQGANMYGVRIFNSDKVFWQRRTDSLCHRAEISGSGVLNDFMLLEDRDLLKDEEDIRDGAWIPETEEEPVIVTFPSPQTVGTVVLHDLPDREHNVGNARITFDDGTSLETGPLEPGGAATRIQVGKTGVSSFSVTLTAGEGTAGLTEIEAFAADATVPSYIKLMDEAGNFAYDYWIDASGEQRFSLYISGAKAVGYRLECSNDACSIGWEGEKIRVSCPEGETAVITVKSEDGAVSDSIVVRNPGPWERKYTMFWLRAEERVMKLCDEKRLHERLFLCRLWEKASVLLG